MPSVKNLPVQQGVKLLFVSDEFDNPCSSERRFLLGSDIL
jgi:hypothetical protein